MAATLAKSDTRQSIFTDSTDGEFSPETENQRKFMQRGRSSQNIEDSASTEEPLKQFKDDLKDVLFKATYASYKMPATAWGSFILSLLIFKFDDWRSGSVIVYAVPQVLTLCASIIVQVILINFLASVEFDTLPDGKCNEEHWLGSITCGCMLGAAVFAGEARETMTMFQFLRCIPNYESDDDDLRRLPDFNADYNKDEEQGQSQDECVRKSKFALVVDVTDGVGRPRTGITRRLRGCLYTVLFVKLGLSAALMGFSFPLVMKSERASDIFLNCCTTLFVLEVDDIIFKLMIPNLLSSCLIATHRSVQESMQDSGPIASCGQIIHLFVDVPFGVIHSSTGTGMKHCVPAFRALVAAAAI